jgi:hypothetical protein
MANPLNALLTTTGLVDLLGVSTRYLWALEKTGVISSIEVGASIRYNADDVLAESTDGTRSE